VTAVPLTDSETPPRWACRNCGVEVHWLGDAEQRELPANWALTDQGPVCLHCRRQLAAEDAVSRSDLPLQKRARLRASTIVEFELRRTPELSNARIASALRTSVGAVQKARMRLGALAAPEPSLRD
jgi:hypothetical protein